MQGLKKSISLVLISANQGRQELAEEKGDLTHGLINFLDIKRNKSVCKHAIIPSYVPFEFNIRV